MNAFEINILDFIRNTFSCQFLDFFFKYYTQIGGTVFMVSFALVLMLIKKTRKTGVALAFALIGGIILSNLIIKNIFDRVRPYDFNKAIELIVAPEHDTSFPSGHSMASFAAAISVFLSNKKAGTVAIVMAVLIAFSRLYLYVHYPSDVLVGVLIGILAAFVGKKISDKIANKYPKLF